MITYDIGAQAKFKNCGAWRVARRSREFSCAQCVNSPAMCLTRHVAALLGFRLKRSIAPGQSLQRRRIAELAVKFRLPSIFPFREYTEAGGLMSYGQNLKDFYRLAAIYVDKILKGARPADLPIEQPTRFYLTINRKAAKALGLTIPQELLIRADEVIE